MKQTLNKTPTRKTESRLARRISTDTQALDLCGVMEGYVRDVIYALDGKQTRGANILSALVDLAHCDTRIQVVDDLDKARRDMADIYIRVMHLRQNLGRLLKGLTGDSDYDAYDYDPEDEEGEE